MQREAGRSRAGSGAAGRARRARHEPRAARPTGSGHGGGSAAAGRAARRPYVHRRRTRGRPVHRGSGGRGAERGRGALGALAAPGWRTGRTRCGTSPRCSTSWDLAGPHPREDRRGRQPVRRPDDEQCWATSQVALRPRRRRRRRRLPPSRCATWAPQRRRRHRTPPRSRRRPCAHRGRRAGGRRRPPGAPGQVAGHGLDELLESWCPGLFRRRPPEGALPELLDREPSPCRPSAPAAGTRPVRCAVGVGTRAAPVLTAGAAVGGADRGRRSSTPRHAT